MLSFLTAALVLTMFSFICVCAASALFEAFAYDKVREDLDQ